MSCGCTNCNTKGFRFQPTEEELMDHHLRKKLLNPDSQEHYISELDLNDYHPSEIPRLAKKNLDDRESYFFWRPQHKKNGIRRTAKHGYWKTTGEVRRVTAKNCGEEIGRKRILVFYEGNYPGKRSPWIVHEFEFTAALPDGEDGNKIFLCKMIRNKDEHEASLKRREAKRGREKEGQNPVRKRKTREEEGTGGRQTNIKIQVIEMCSEEIVEPNPSLHATPNSDFEVTHPTQVATPLINDIMSSEGLNPSPNSCLNYDNVDSSEEDAINLHSPTGELTSSEGCDKGSASLCLEPLSQQPVMNSRGLLENEDSPLEQKNNQLNIVFGIIRSLPMPIVEGQVETPPLFPQPDHDSRELNPSPSGSPVGIHLSKIERIVGGKSSWCGVHSVKLKPRGEEMNRHISSEGFAHSANRQANLDESMAQEDDELAALLMFWDKF